MRPLVRHRRLVAALAVASCTLAGAPAHAQDESGSLLSRVVRAPLEALRAVERAGGDLWTTARGDDAASLAREVRRSASAAPAARDAAQWTGTRLHALSQSVRPLASTAVRTAGFVGAVPTTARALRGAADAVQAATPRQAVDGLIRSQVGVSPTEMSRASQTLASSSAAKQLAQPFTPTNLALGVGATALAGVLAEATDGEQGVDVGRAVSFLGERRFWGALVGSSVGYGLLSVAAAAVIPGGVGLIPTLGPLMVGMVGSQYGWEAGGRLAAGEGLSGLTDDLSLGKALGQAGGSTIGLVTGAHMAAVIGGSVGAVAGPVGAIAGALIVGRIGAELGEAIGGGDPSAVDQALTDANADLAQLRDASRTVRGYIGPAAPSSSEERLFVPSSAPDDVDAALRRREGAGALVLALEAGDRAAVRQRWGALQAP